MTTGNTILITGGAGFIGSHIADFFLLKEFKVIILDNFITSKRENITSKIEVAVGDIGNKLVVDNIFSQYKPDFVIHAAASYKDPDDWSSDINTNVIGTVNVVNAAKKFSCKKFVYLQTSLCYGLHPIESPISINHPLFSGSYSGGSSYAISKTNGELYIELSGINFTSLRLANVYGPRNLSGPIPAFFKNISNNTKSTIYNTQRDFVYVSDVVDCVFKVVQKSNNKKYYNVSSGKEYSIEHIYRIMRDIININSEVIPIMLTKSDDDTERIWLDSSETKQDLNWNARVELSEGVSNTIEYYKKNGLDNIFSHLRLYK